MITLPEGYEQLQNGPATIIVAAPYSRCLLEQGLADPERLMAAMQSGPESLKGRGAVPSAPIPGRPGEHMLIRKYLRGGFLRFFNRDMYLGPMRPFRELQLTLSAAASGIPAPEILAAVSVQAMGLLYRGYLISKELTGSRDLPAHLASCARENPADFEQQKTALLEKIAAAVRRMHDAGFFHGDLNLKNILVEADRPLNITLIDWDKSRAVGQSLEPADRRANVQRFCRSMVKLTRGGLALSESDPLKFLESYWEGRSDEIERGLQRLNLSLSVRKMAGHTSYRGADHGRKQD